MNMFDLGRHHLTSVYYSGVNVYFVHTLMVYEAYLQGYI